MSNYLLNTTPTQKEPMAGTVPNNAEGQVYKLDDWKRLERFLILGSEGGTYYASERKLTLDNTQTVRALIARDGEKVIRYVLDIDRGNRAPKKGPLVWTLALASKVGNDDTRRAARKATLEVCRTGTDILQWASFVNGMGGWGRGTRRTVAEWFTSKEADKLAYQAVKYQQRDGWALRDLLRLAHPKPLSDSAHHSTMAWIAGLKDVLPEFPDVILAFEELKTPGLPGHRVASIVQSCGVPREAVPSEYLTNPLVWEALLSAGGITMVLRNLATMTRVGLVAPGSAGTDKVAGLLTDPDVLRKGRVHPLAVLVALKTYQQGHGERGSHTWTPVPRVVEALDAAFYESFGVLPRSKERYIVGVDVSGSMGSGTIAGLPGITPAVGAAAMAMATMATAPNSLVLGFTSGHHGEDGVTLLDISPRRRLDDVIKHMQSFRFGGTDAALPIQYAHNKGLDIDKFVTITDNETWAGRIHPAEALRQYRQLHSNRGKLVVVGMTATEFTIADPNDAGMLDIAGFDTAAPSVIANF